MLDKIPPHLLGKIMSDMSRLNVARTTAVSKSIRHTAKKALTLRSRHRGVFRSAIKLKTLASRLRRPAGSLSPRKKTMVLLTRILARVPKTYRHPNGSTYRPRERMQAFLFRNGQPRTLERNVFQGYTRGRANGTHFFSYNPYAGGHFRNGQWNIIIPVARPPYISKRS
jgi:hypothetical protein